MLKKDIKARELIANNRFPGSAPEPVVVLDTISLWTKGWSKKRNADVYRRSEDSRYNVQGGYAGYVRVVTGYLALSLDNDHNHGDLRDNALKEMMNLVASLPAELTAVDVNALHAVLPHGVHLGVWNNRYLTSGWQTLNAEYEAKQARRRDDLERKEAEAYRRQALADLVDTAAKERGITLDRFRSAATATISVIDLAQLLGVTVPDNLASPAEDTEGE